MLKLVVYSLVGTLGILGAVFLGQNASSKQEVVQSKAPVFGATDFKFAQLQPYYLNGSGALAGATSITLKSMKDIDGNTLTMSAVFGTKGFGTLEPGNGTREEQISFTGLVSNSNGTVTLTGISSVAFVYPYKETPGLSKTHPGSATFVVSNTSGFYNQLMSPINNATITAMYLFSSTTPPRYDSVGLQAQGTYNATTSEFASIFYVNKIAAAGCATASAGVLGCVSLSTQVQSASSTFSAGNPTVLSSAYSTSSPGSAGLWTVITRNSGKIAQAFLDFTEAFTFTGTLTSTATTTIAASNASTTALVLNGLPYSLPATRGASSTVLTENGYGRLVWELPDWRLLASTSTANAVSTTTLTNIPAATNLRIIVDTGTISGSSMMYLQFNGDTAANYAWNKLTQGAVNSNTAGTSGIRLTQILTTHSLGGHIDITNVATRAKTVNAQIAGSNGSTEVTGDTTWGSWNNTSAQISSISIGCGTTACPAGMRISIYGSNF